VRNRHPPLFVIGKSSREGTNLRRLIPRASRICRPRDVCAYPNALPGGGKIDAIGLSKADFKDWPIDRRDYANALKRTWPKYVTLCPDSTGLLDKLLEPRHPNVHIGTINKSAWG
jgi:hypothetical protein